VLLTELQEFSGIESLVGPDFHQGLRLQCLENRLGYRIPKAMHDFLPYNSD
jgi:hypothetical protein